MTPTLIQKADSWLAPFRRDPRLGYGTGAGLAALWGLAAGWWMPRGPLTTGEALWSLGLSFLVGTVVGVVVGRWWTVVLAPVVFAALFELARLGTDGPLVDGIRFTTFGGIAFVVGRAFHSLMTLVPLAIGAGIGVGAAVAMERSTRSDRLRPDGFRRLVGPGAAAVGVVSVVAFGALLARPARTAPIVDASGESVAGSIAELTTVEIGGHDLALMIRGHDRDNPVLLFLAGGPGGSELGAMRNHLPELERHFTVVTWDQRGTGKSYPELDPTDTLTLEGYVSDTLEVTDHLRSRFGQDEIYLLGQSWGTTLGVLAIQAAPEKYRGYIGTGQMVSQLATDLLFYRDTRQWAVDTGRDDLAERLDEVGPPPYSRIDDYEFTLASGNDVYPYDHSVNSEGAGGFSENFLVEEYTLLEQVHLFAAFMDTFSVVYPQLQDIDFRATATSFEVPVFFVQGVHEADARTEVFEEWYPMIEAPMKDLVELDTSGHRPLFEQPDEFVAYMVDTVLARTGP